MRAWGVGVAFVLLLSAAFVAAEDAAPFLLAVMRRDGVVLPFASYDGRRWRNPWPAPSLTPEVPLSLRDVPAGWWGKGGVAAQWRFWPLDRETQPVAAQNPVWVQSQCQMMVGLKTDRATTGPVPPPVQQPHPKDGLAITSDQRIDRVEIRSEASSDWSEFVGFLQDVVRRPEERVIEFYRQGAGWPHPVRANMRKTAPFGLEALYRAPIGPSDRWAYFFEGTKRYPMPAAADRPPCDLVTFVRGWVVREANGAKSPFNVTAAVSYCNLTSVELMLPLGLLRLGDQSLWVVQWSGWGHERYSILEVAPGRVKPVLEASGGLC
jgi:hypothetical protein